MQISKVNTAVPRKTRQGSGRNENNINNINSKSQTNFKGIGAGLDAFALGTANLIENGGLAVSFTLQDMLGTNLPRPIMGLMRNSKENKGEKNKSFAFKELVREMLTGPSMFLIPMGILALTKKSLGATVNTPMNFIKDFGKIHAANPLSEAGKTIGKDKKSGKLTYVSLYGLEKAKEKFSLLINDCYDIVKQYNSKIFMGILDKLRDRILGV